MTIKVFVTSNFKANFICPECGRSDKKDVSKFIGHETKVTLKYKCQCKHRYSVVLERRRSIRKEVHLKGNIIRHSKKYAIKIEDLSKHGFKIKLFESLALKENEIIKLEFNLDDPSKSRVSMDVRIRQVISPFNITCEFTSSDHHGSLGKYFLFYY